MRSAGRDVTWQKTARVAVLLDNINVMNVKLCMIVRNKRTDSDFTYT